jgi:aryl-alcohol dehydrogenase-like predicted oxidoreductase
MSIFKDFSVIQKKGVLPDWFQEGSKIGLSVYETKEIEDEMRIYSYSYDIYQFPINVLDTRFLKYLKPLEVQHFEIHARSVFLQGLLLMRELPAWISTETMLKIHSFRNICNQKKLQYYEVALGWVLGLKDIDYVIVGVNSAEQLKQLLEVKPLKWDYDFSITDEKVLNPRKWPKQPDIEFLRKHNSINYG